MSTAEHFGRTIKTLRKHKGLTQEELAQLVDRSVDAISQIERGVNLPSFGTLDRLSTALGAPVREFFQSDDKTSEKRAELLTMAGALLRELSDKDLKIALRQLMALAQRD